LEETIASAANYIDADIGRVGVAAAALLAMKAARHRPGGVVPSSTSEVLRSWRKIARKPELLARALLALDKVRGQSSEAASLWDPEGTGASPWHEQVERIAGPLRGKAKA
jgi:hypothetical protein